MCIYITLRHYLWQNCINIRWYIYWKKISFAEQKKNLKRLYCLSVPQTLYLQHSNSLNRSLLITFSIHLTRNSFVSCIWGLMEFLLLYSFPILSVLLSPQVYLVICVLVTCSLSYKVFVLQHSTHITVSG